MVDVVGERVNSKVQGSYKATRKTNSVRISAFAEGRYGALFVKGIREIAVFRHYGSEEYRS